MQFACLLLNIEFIPTPSLTQLYTIQRSNVYHKDMYDILPIHRSSFPRCGVQHTAHWRVQSASHRRALTLGICNQHYSPSQTRPTHLSECAHALQNPTQSVCNAIRSQRSDRRGPPVLVSAEEDTNTRAYARLLTQAGVSALRNTTHNLRNVSLIRKDPPPAFALNTVHNYAHCVCVCVYGRRTGRRIEQQTVSRTYAALFPRKLLTQTPVDS